MADVQAYLIGGGSDGETIGERHFRVKRVYEDGRWECYEHVDLGAGYPFVLRAAADPLSNDEVIARLKALRIIPST